MIENESSASGAACLTSAEMREIEQKAIASGRVTGLELMERAGQGVVDAICEEWCNPAQSESADRGASPSGSPGYFLQDEERKAVVLCGPGNNGGDGFVVARLLAARGWSVDVFFYGDGAKLPPDAKTNYERWLGIGAVSTLTDAAFDGYSCNNPQVALYVDALFGTGLARPFLVLDRVQYELNLCQAQLDTKVVAVDIPSGLSADTGEYLGYGGENAFDLCIVADLTVTFHKPKCGHLIGVGPAACGKLVVKDIGL